ncbi:unnamed protein product [Leptidea sinapis]|uniref:Uncharacterized protein n=1 Tax=Leptidea sinapis TaxID=189913 RepID=A0A5E4Q1I3_9NEOP|nr:unnamed protein product [Leptidea sinapis]
MEDTRCATCEALGRRSLSSKLLQVATAQAHLRTCNHAVPTPDQLHGSDLATRALAAKRRKSIAGLKLNLSSDSAPRSAVPEKTRSNAARRNTWCSYTSPNRSLDSSNTAPLQAKVGTHRSRKQQSLDNVEAMQSKLISSSYSSIMNKQDLLREVVIKYIDYFYPVASGTSAVAIDNKIEQAMPLCANFKKPLL